MSTASDEIWAILNRLAKRSEDAEQMISEDRERMREIRESMKDTDQRMKDTDRKLKEVTAAIGRLGNRLGEFVEEMVRPAVVRVFQERGIAVHQVCRGVYAERDGDAMEIDLLVVNGQDAILVEVKSELKVDDVKEHVSRLQRFKKLCPQYAGFRVMGAVAGMVVPEDPARYAYRQGLFVLAQSGETVAIRNDAAFQPGIW